MIHKINFGETGHRSSRIIFGGAALWATGEQESKETLELLLQYGINHIDTAASYGDSELNVGEWMGEHRKRFFLATKTDKRTYQEAKDELHLSLERLKVDYVDLWQMHNLVNDEQWEKALSADGAIEAFIEAREEGLVKFLGVTGHGLGAPSMHRRSLEQFDFDSVLLPYNFILMQNSEYAEDFKVLSNICDEKNVAMQTIKSLARGPLGDKKPKYSVWYDPLETDDAIKNAVHWVLGNSQVFLNGAGDINLLKKVLKAAAEFETSPSDKIMTADVENFNVTSLFASKEI